MTHYNSDTWGTLSEVLSSALNLSASTPGVVLKDCHTYRQLMKDGHSQAIQAAFRRKDGSDRILRLIGNGGTGMVFEEMLPNGSVSPEIIRIGPDILVENVVIKGKHTVLEPSWHAVANVGDEGYLITSSPKLKEGRVTPEIFNALKAKANAEGVDFIDQGSAEHNYNGNVMFLEDGTPMIVDGARDLEQYAKDPELSPGRRERAMRDLERVQEHGKSQLEHIQKKSSDFPSWDNGNGVRKQDLLNRNLSEPVSHQTITLQNPAPALSSHNAGPSHPEEPGTKTLAPKEQFVPPVDKPAMGVVEATPTKPAVTIADTAYVSASPEIASTAPKTVSTNPSLPLHNEEAAAIQMTEKAGTQVGSTAVHTQQVAGYSPSVSMHSAEKNIVKAEGAFSSFMKNEKWLGKKGLVFAAATVALGAVIYGANKAVSITEDKQQPSEPQSWVERISRNTPQQRSL